MALILTTARLRLREVEPGDAAFLLELLNTREFKQNIGDRRLRTLDDARSYIENNIHVSYRQHGIGLWVIESKADSTLLGLCGLLKRDTLEHPDVGYALLPAAFGHGYATEAAGACVHHGKTVLGLGTVCAIVSPHNQGSIHVLEKIGLRFEREVPGGEPGQVLKLFS